MNKKCRSFRSVILSIKVLVQVLGANEQASISCSCKNSCSSRLLFNDTIDKMIRCTAVVQCCYSVLANLCEFAQFADAFCIVEL